MTPPSFNWLRRPRARRAFTFIELVLALSIMSILMAMLGSAIVFMGRTLDHDASPRRRTADAADVSRRIAADLKLATTFDDVQRTATSVAFTVPDRTGDGVPDTVRYAWAGPGAALTRSLNDADPAPLLESVEDFALSYQTTTIVGTGGTSESGDTNGLRVLFVVDRPDNLSTDESLRRFILQSWGHTVTLIDDEDDPAEYDAQVPGHDIAYVSDRVNDGQLDTKLLDAAIGVVIEQREVPKRMLLSEDQGSSTNTASFLVDDNTHYITAPFFPGLLPVLSATDGLVYFDKPLADGAVALGTRPGHPADRMLFTIETGYPLYDGTPAAGRRVMMPWGNQNDFALVNEAGLTLLRRALEWAAEAEVPDPVESPLFAQDDDPGTTNKDHTVKWDDWAVASIVPALPPDALAWKLTRARFLAQQRDEPDATLSIQVRGRAPDGAPTTEVLAQEFITESALPLTYGWVEVPIAMLDWIPPDEGACICIGMLSGSNGGQVLYEDGNGEATPSNQFYKGSPGDWSTGANRDIPFEVEGTVQVP